MVPLTTVPTDPVALDELRRSLRSALDGDAVIAPLPTHDLEREQVLAMLRPELPVTEPDAAVVVATSGSTGLPKGVVLTRAGIAASARATHTRLGGAGDWLLALPAHYVAGLMVLARAELAGTSLHVVGADLSGLAELPAPDRPRYLSVVPTQLVRALTDPRLTRRLAALDAVLLGGAAAPADLLARARDAGIPVRTTYGMSETCGGCVYDGVPLDGIDASITDPDTSGVGRVELTGTPVFAGYRRRPELTGSALVVDGDVRRFRTQDRGRLVDGRLELLGRIDDVVVSGGINVDLAAVEWAARQTPGLTGADVVVLGVPDPEWGVRVVLVTDRTVDPAVVRGELAALLPPHAVPRAVVRRAPIPRTSSGKPDRLRLTTELAGRLSDGAAAGAVTR